MKKLLALLMLSSATMAEAATITLYQNNFDSPATTYAGVSATLGGYTNIVSGGGLEGFSGNFLWNDSKGLSTRLQLLGLPSHSSISVSYRFAFVDSWDSNTNSVFPDYFNMTIDGSNVLQITCNNASGSLCDNGIGTNSSGFSNVFGNFWNDLSRDVAVSPLHSGSTLNIALFASGNGWEGGIYESWALDNILVTATNNVPEPATLALMGLGFASMAYMRRRQAQLGIPYLSQR